MVSERLASVISLAFNPAVMTGLAFLILFSRENTPNSTPLIVTCVTFGTVVPLAIIYQLSKRGLVSDFYVSEKDERAKPFAGVTSSYLIGVSALLLLKAPLMVTALMACFASNTLMMMLITFRWKISVHASGIACPATALIYSLGTWGHCFLRSLSTQDGLE